MKPRTYNQNTAWCCCFEISSANKNSSLILSGILGWVNGFLGKGTSHTRLTTQFNTQTHVQNQYGGSPLQSSIPTARWEAKTVGSPGKSWAPSLGEYTAAAEKPRDTLIQTGGSPELTAESCSLTSTPWYSYTHACVCTQKDTHMS